MSLLRGGCSLRSDEDALKREEEQARRKKSKTSLFCISPQYQDRFWIAVFILPWPNEHLAFDIAAAAAEDTRISGSEASTQAVHFKSQSQRSQTGPKCTLPSFHVKTSPVGQQDFLLLLLDASFQGGVVAGVGRVADHRGVPGTSRTAHEGPAKFAAFPPAAQKYHSNGTNKNIHYFFGV